MKSSSRRVKLKSYGVRDTILLPVRRNLYENKSEWTGERVQHAITQSTNKDTPSSQTWMYDTLRAAL